MRDHPARLPLAAPVMLLATWALSVSAAQHDHQTTSAPLGGVPFATSCKPAVARLFDRGVSALHAFWFDAAIVTFKLVAHADVDCAMAWWGIGLAAWGDPFEERPPHAIEAGRRAIADASAARRASVRERRYVAAVAELYRDEPLDSETRFLAYQRAITQLSEDYPKDAHAAAFAALAHSSTAASSAATSADRQRAAERLASLHQQYPEHAGIAHYLILSHDEPMLAPKALQVARRYVSVAPPTAHALHAPSHVFTRTGNWEESIRANLASADAARRDGVVTGELHALDFQVHALLQSGRDRAAAAILRRLPGFRALTADAAAANPATRSATADFALAAIPARVALERGDWSAAADLELHDSPFAEAQSLTHFARGLGAARRGDVAAARIETARLAAIADTARLRHDRDTFRRADVRRRVVEAWSLFAERQRDAARAQLAAAAADAEAGSLRRASPGSIGPPRELFGEMLLDVNRPGEALAAFEAQLAIEPNRLRSLHGAARAANEAGQAGKAGDYYNRIVALTRGADDPPRPLIEEARTWQKQAELRRAPRLARSQNVR